MKLAFITACVYPSTQPIHMLQASADRLDIKLQPYGVGESPGGWGDIKVTKLLPCLDRLKAKGYTHVLYIDGVDSLFVRGYDAIMDEYYALASPELLMSTEVDCWPLGRLAPFFDSDAQTRFRYPNAGQYMGEIDYIAEKFAMLQQEYFRIFGDVDQAWITQGIVDGKMDGLVLDTTCSIFQSMSGAATSRNPDTCVLHFNGGYVDPVDGRDARMKPVWEEICAKS